MKGKKKKLVWCLLFTVLLSITGPLGNTEDYQAADVYTNAMEFFFATGDIDDKHIDIVDGTIYFGTRAKLAHTYASGHKYYRTLGYDVTMSAGGKSLTFSVKRGGTLMEVPDSDKVDSSGYQYLLYKIPTRKIMELAELADPTNAATVLAASKIEVRMDAIVTVRQGGQQGSIVEDGKGGITEYEANGPIYHLKNASELEEMMDIFPGHKFISYYNIRDYLENYKLTNYYNVGPATVGNTSYTKGTYSGNSNMLFQNGSIYNKEKSTLLQEFKLMDPGANGLKLNYTGYHLDAGEEWKKSDGTLMSISKTYMPKEIEPSVGFGDKSLVLYANWKPNTYYVEYNANGGTGTMSKTTATYDKEFKLTKNAFTRTGYKFIGWATSENSKTVVYTDQKTVSNLTATNGGTVKLYAVWQELVYTVTLDSTTPVNKDAQKPGTKSFFEKYNIGFYKEKDCTTKISSITKPEEPGYIFMGYYSGKNGAGAQYIDESGKFLSSATSTTFISDRILYAKWKPIEYKIRYNANGGKGSMDDTPATYDKETFLRSNAFTLTGYKFTGWATSANGSVIYDDLEEILNLTMTDGKVINLYAVWEANIYTIDLNNDGADIAAGTSVYYEKYEKGNYTTEGCTQTISSITKPQKKGYIFGGYYTSREGLGDEYIDATGKILSTSTTFTSHKTLYAKWIPHEYTIKYDANGGTGTMEDTKAVYDKEVTLRTAMFTNTGKNFMGWSAEKNGNVHYSDRDTVLNLTEEDGGEIILYAVWSENIYTITLNSDGADNNGTENYYEKYDVGNYKDSGCTTEISTITKPQKNGYVFGGYYTSKGGAGVSYIDASGKITATSTTFTTNKTLYAKWTITGYTIQYDGNGGVGSMTDTEAVYNQTVSLRPNGFLNSGKSFKGWSRTRDGAVEFKDKQSVRNLNTVDGEIITLYAVWEEDLYTITLNSDGAEIQGTEKYYEKYSIGNYKDSDCTQIITTITKPVWTGRTFGGYYTGKDGTGDSYINSTGTITAENTTFTSDITLYAKWTPNRYRIKYDANGGSGTMMDTVAVYGEALPLSTCTFTFTGRTFKGWSLTADGSARYADKETVRNLTLDESITLYAVWEEDVYTITLNNDGGETKGTECYYEKYSIGNYSDRSCKQEISSITKPTRTGRTFGGYYTGRDGTGEQYISSSGSITATNTTFTSDTTLYAYWLTNAYTIKYDANGGTGSMADTTVFYGETVSLSPCTFTNTGKMFKGWSLTADGSAQYADKDSVKNLTLGTSITLYAVWQEDVYTIILNNEGAETAGSENYYEKYSIGNYKDSSCTQIISSITKPAWTGKTFGGYYTGRDGTGDQYVAADGTIMSTSTTFTSDTTLYAYWMTNTYTIRYNANGGSGTMADTSVAYGETVSLRPCTFTNTGRTFKGWSRTTDGSVQYPDKESITNLAASGTVILYAVWEENVYTVTLNSEGAENTGTGFYYEKYSIGNFSDSSCSQSISSITKPSWAGKIFGGYYTGRNGTGTQYISASGSITASDTTFTSDTILYACWTTNTYTIRYNANGGSGTMADTSVAYGETVSLRTCTFTNTGHTFKGWSTAADGSVWYVDRDSVKDLAYSGTVVLYAVWEPYSVQISLDHQGGTGDRNAFYEKYGTAFYSDSLFSSIITQITKPVMPGFTFKGYFENSMGSGNPVVNESGTIAVGNTAFLKDILVFAKWVPKMYMVTLDQQGGTEGSTSVTATYGQLLPSADAPQRPGYIFKGYYTEKGGNGTKFYDGFMNTDIVYMEENDRTLYAYWMDESAPEVVLTASPEKWTNQKVTLTAHASDNGSGLASVIIYEIASDDSLIPVASADGLNGAKTKEISFENTKEGVVRYKAVAEDAAGNTAESYSTAYYDITAPEAELTFNIDGTVISIELDITDINTGD